MSEAPTPPSDAAADIINEVLRGNSYARVSAQMDAKPATYHRGQWSPVLSKAGDEEPPPSYSIQVTAPVGSELRAAQREAAKAARAAGRAEARAEAAETRLKESREGSMALEAELATLKRTLSRERSERQIEERKAATERAAEIARLERESEARGREATRAKAALASTKEQKSQLLAKCNDLEAKAATLEREMAEVRKAATEVRQKAMEEKLEQSERHAAEVEAARSEIARLEEAVAKSGAELAAKTRALEDSRATNEAEIAHLQTLLKAHNEDEQARRKVARNARLAAMREAGGLEVADADGNPLAFPVRVTSAERQSRKDRLAALQARMQASLTTLHALRGDGGPTRIVEATSR